MAKDNNQDMMNLALLGAAAWVAYNYFFQSPNPQTAAGTPTPGAVGNTGQPGNPGSPAAPTQVQQQAPSQSPAPQWIPQEPTGGPNRVLDRRSGADTGIRGGGGGASSTALTSSPTTGGSGSGVNAALQAAAASSGDRLNLDQWAWYAQNAAKASLGVDAYFTTDAMIGRQNQTTLSTWLASGGTAYLSALTGGLSGLSGYISNFSPTPARIPVDIATTGVASGWAD